MGRKASGELPTSYQQWTRGAIECYERKCICWNCPIDKLFEGRCYMWHAVSMLLKNVGEPPEVYKGRKAWVEDCIKRISAGEKTRSIAESYGMSRYELTWRLNCEGVRIKDYKKLKLYN